MKKIILPVILLSLILLIYLLYKSNENDKDYLLLSGNIEVKEVNLSFKFSGKISELYFEEGASVKKDEILGKIEAKDIEREMELQKEILEEAKIKLSELKKGSREQEIKEAEANLKAREAEMEKAKKDYERAEVLFKNGAISQSKFEEYKKILDLSSSNYERAMEILSLKKEGPREEEILAQEKRINQIEARIKIIEEKLKDAALYSPVDGIVLSKNAEVGEMAGPNLPVYTLGQIDKPYVKVYVKEDKLGLIKIGQKAEVFCDTYPGKIYEGKISYISSKAEFTPKNIQTKEERTKLVFEVKVYVKNDEDKLKPGMPVDVKIKIE